MTCKLGLLAPLAFGLWMSVAAAEAPENSKLLKQCESAKGQVKRECEAVAKEMIRKQPAAEERADKTDQDITHSSPAMTTPAEAKKKEERAKQKPQD